MVVGRFRVQYICLLISLQNLLFSQMNKQCCIRQIFSGNCSLRIANCGTREDASDSF